MTVVRAANSGILHEVVDGSVHESGCLDHDRGHPPKRSRRVSQILRFSRASTEAGGSEAASGQPVSLSTRSPAQRTQRPHRDGIVFGLFAVALLTALVVFLGIRAHAADGLQHARARFLEAGRQSAIMLTTVNHEDVEAAAERIIDSSAGAFLADFRNRSQGFVDIVRRTQSNTEGTIAEVGLKSVQGDHADVLVAVWVKTSLAGVDSPARLWRMLIAVQKVSNDIKLTNVEFIA